MDEAGIYTTCVLPNLIKRVCWPRSLRSWICLHPVCILSISMIGCTWLAPCIRHPSLRQFNTLTISLFCYSAAAGGSDRVDEILLQDNDLHDRIPGVRFGMMQCVPILLIHMHRKEKNHANKTVTTQISDSRISSISDLRRCRSQISYSS